MSKLTLVEAYNKINNILDSVKEGDVTVDDAVDELAEVKANFEGSLAIPDRDELEEIFNANYTSSTEYSSSYESSYY